MILMWIAKGFVLLLAVRVCARLLHRRSRRKARAQSRELIILPMAGLTLDAMFLGLQAIVQPRVPHAIVELQKEKSWDDNNRDEPPGGRAFHQGLRKIRAGEDAGALEVRMASSPDPR